jgi:hypothetical protein
MKSVRYVGMVLESGVEGIPLTKLIWNSAKRYDSIAKTMHASTTTVIMNAHVQVVFGQYIFLVRGPVDSGGVNPSREWYPPSYGNCT